MITADEFAEAYAQACAAKKAEADRKAAELAKAADVEMVSMEKGFDGMLKQGVLEFEISRDSYTCASVAQIRKLIKAYRRNGIYMRLDVKHEWYMNTYTRTVRVLPPEAPTWRKWLWRLFRSGLWSSEN